MTSPSQPEPLVADLGHAENLVGHGGEVKFVATHASYVFLCGDEVWKVKRPVDYGFLDYSTAAKRRHFCEEEVRLNRRTAPEVYLGVVPVRRDERGHSLVRGGEIVDWAVHMQRLPDERSALARLQANALADADVLAIARTAAALYRDATPHPPDADALARSIEENFAQTEPFVGRWITADLLAELRERQRRWLADQRPLLATRNARDGHGDLRLEHVYLRDDGPILIDCIEFNERFRIADPALDAAFLAMDLLWRGRADLAERFLAQFAYETDDYDAYPLLDGYVSYRAFVRGKVACFVAGGAHTPPVVQERKGHEAASLFHLAREVLAAPRPRPKVIAVGGIVAAGKSTVAQRIAAQLAAPIVSADATRKFLAGLPRDAHGGPELYTDAMHRRVHDELLRRARAVLEGGRSVVLDTSFRTRALRARARALADAVDADFVLVECRVPLELARQRLQQRTTGVSDAREDLLDRFVADFEPIDELPWNEHVVLDGQAHADHQLARLRAAGVIPRN